MASTANVREVLASSVGDDAGREVIEAASSFDRGVALIELALSQLRRDNADTELRISKAKVGQDG